MRDVPGAKESSTCFKRGEQFFLPHVLASIFLQITIGLCPYQCFGNEGLKSLSEPLPEFPGKGMWRQHTLSHEPRIEIRGMTTHDGRRHNMPLIVNHDHQLA